MAPEQFAKVAQNAQLRSDFDTVSRGMVPHHRYLFMAKKLIETHGTLPHQARMRLFLSHQQPGSDFQ